MPSHKHWWQLPAPAIYDSKGRVLPMFQRVGEPPRIVVALWTKEASDGSGYRQYSLWSSGRIETRLFADWAEWKCTKWRRRKKFRWDSRLPYRLNKFFRKHGYERTFITQKHELERL